MCKRSKITIERLHILAKEKGGKCLSAKYINSKTKYLWKCSKGHMWHTIYGNILYNGTWCGACVNRKQLNIGHCHDLAEKFDGK